MSCTCLHHSSMCPRSHRNRTAETPATLAHTQAGDLLEYEPDGSGLLQCPSWLHRNHLFPCTSPSICTAPFVLCFSKQTALPNSTVERQLQHSCNQVHYCQHLIPTHTYSILCLLRTSSVVSCLMLCRESCGAFCSTATQHFQMRTVFYHLSGSTQGTASLRSHTV